MVLIIMEKECINIVWLKRDLRINDHEPIMHALNGEFPFLVLFCFEPSIIQQSVYEKRHWRFAYQSSQAIKPEFDKAQIPFLIAHQEVETVLERISEKYLIKKVFSYQETGIKLSYERDKQMASWFKKSSIDWFQFTWNGVFRGLKSRENWAKNWQNFMTMPIYTPHLNAAKPLAITGQDLLYYQGEDLPNNFTDVDSNFQPGGYQYAWRYLNSFLQERGKNYSKHIGWPHYSRVSCSRISPYLAWGNVSMREIYHVLNDAYPNSNFKRSLANFRSRLFWNGHFIQKFESEERIEYENFNRAFDLVEKPFSEAYFNAWTTGQTGFPLVDACMRCVKQTGYINFRMRAMVVSFYTLHLWQPWQYAASWLATQFLDFEPGIHYPQVQMQAGTTGTHLIRIYNVVKQSEERDPEGLFIKKWLPELSNVPSTLIHKVWELSQMEQGLYGVVIGQDYPKPIIDLEQSGKKAREIMFGMQKTPTAMLENKRILKKHVPLKNQDEAPQES